MGVPEAPGTPSRPNNYHKGSEMKLSLEPWPTQSRTCVLILNTVTSYLNKRFEYNPESANILGKMSRIQYKITHHIKNQGNYNLKEKRHLKSLNTKMNQMLESYDKDFNKDIIKILQQSIINSLETNEK